MLPKNCRSFPKGGKGSQCYAAIIGNTLRAELGGSHQCIKTIMKWTGAKERTIENWLAGANGPSGEHLIELIRHSDEICYLVLRSAGRNEALASIRVANARRHLIGAIAELDRIERP
jgi:hypothetical protein